MEHFFAPCPRGLETLLEGELGALSAKDVKSTDGGRGIRRRPGARDAREPRVALRKPRAVARGRRRVPRRARALRPRAGHRLEALLLPTRTLRVDVSATRSPLQSLEFGTLRVKDAVCDRLRADTSLRPSIDKRAPDVRVLAYLTDRDATLYVDTSGEPLFKRGYRRDTDEAPLRENLAAGIVALTGWTPGTTLLDPMCGSGTLVAEAAMMAADRAPGLTRTFGFQKLAWFEGPPWQRMKQAARDRVRAAPASPALFASDIAQGAVAKTQSNLRAAQVDAFVHVEQADFLVRAAPASGGILVTNPPYGVRLADQEAVAKMYPLIGDALKQRYAGWTAYFFTGDLRLPKLIHLKVTRRTPLMNGAIDCRLFAFPMVSGRHE